jgi:hypothetical protein
MTEEFQSCMGGDESVCDSEYERLEDAIARCQAIVRESVDKLRQSGVRTPLIDLYDSKGVRGTRLCLEGSSGNRLTSTIQVLEAIEVLKSGSMGNRVGRRIPVGALG